MFKRTVTQHVKSIIPSPESVHKVSFINELAVIVDGVMTFFCKIGSSQTKGRKFQLIDRIIKVYYQFFTKARRKVISYLSAGRRSIGIVNSNLYFSAFHEGP